MSNLLGVDVASFQGEPAHWRAAAGSYEFAAVKFTELSASGLYTSPDAVDDWHFLKGAGKGRIAYLFAHPSAASVQTVSDFLKSLDAAGLEDGDGIAIDLEVSDGLPAVRVAEWGTQVASQLHVKTGRKPLLYTFLNFAQEGNCAGLGGYPLWISDPSSPAGQPRVPEPWTNWAIHQYDTSGQIDRDNCRYQSLSAFRAEFGKPAAPKPPVAKPAYAEVTVADWHTPNPPWNSTLTGIAAHEHTTMAELLRLNPEIRNADDIKAGQKIKVPVRP